jgi:hypothetical protein
MPNRALVVVAVAVNAGGVGVPEITVGTIDAPATR